MGLFGGFSPKNAVMQFGSVVNPTGGVSNYDVFTDRGVQRGGGDPAPLTNRITEYADTGYKYGQPTGQDSGSTLGSSTGSSTPSYSREDLAYLDSQRANLERQLGRTDITLRDALDAALQNYNKSLSETNTARGRAMEDFSLKEQISNAGRERALDQVDTGARGLAESLRRRIGLASGSGSSAYQITAPRAVQQDASEKRQDVLEDYSANFLALERDKKLATKDFEDALKELSNQYNARQSGAYGDIENQRNQIRENLGRVAGERQRLLGGGYDAVRQAMAPYEQQIAGGESFLDGLYNKYAAKYNVKPVEVANTQLRDYAVDKTAVRDNEARGTQNEYAPYRTYLEDEEEKL